MNSVKQFRIANDIRQVEIAEYLGISKSFLSNVEADRCKLPADKLTKLINNDKGWDTSMLYEPMAHGNVLVSYSPHTNIATHGSFIGHVPEGGAPKCVPDLVPVIPYRLYNESGTDIMEYLRNNRVNLTPAVAQFAKTDCMYLVNTDAMSPSFKSGDYLALKLVGKSAVIVNGDVYAVDTDENGILLRYVYDRGDSFEMRSPIDRFEPFFVPKEQVFNVFRVVGLIRTNI